jgi:hypothetical protein
MTIHLVASSLNLNDEPDTKPEKQGAMGEENMPGRIGRHL